MDKLEIQSNSRFAADVVDPIIISEGDRTRFVLLATINDMRIKEGKTVSATIAYQRKSAAEEWETITSQKLSELKNGEGIKLAFDSNQTLALYDGLTKLYEVGSKGVPYGRTSYVVGEQGEILQSTPEKIRVIKQLLEQGLGIQVWEQLVESNPDLATRLSISRIHAERERSVAEFEEGLDLETDENYWQKFFESNTWIFGYGLRYVFLALITSQPNYGGTDFSGKGTQRGDFLLRSEATAKFTVLVEIKRPDTQLFKYEKGEVKKYRNGAALLSDEFVGAVSQLQSNCDSWLKESGYEKNNTLSEEDKTYTVSPKGFLIIGRNREFASHRVARRTFELFRSRINGIEIVTFDELFERAKFINIKTEPVASEVDDFDPDPGY